MVHALMRAARIQDRDGEAMVLGHLARIVCLPAETLRRRWLSGGTGVTRHRKAYCLDGCGGDCQTLRRATGFVVLPRQWGERTLAWLNRCRRLAEDWENLKRKGASVPVALLHPPDGRKSMPELRMFSNRPLGGTLPPEIGTLSVHFLIAMACQLWRLAFRHRRIERGREQADRPTDLWRRGLRSAEEAQATRQTQARALSG